MGCATGERGAPYRPIVVFLSRKRTKGEMDTPDPGRIGSGVESVRPVFVRLDRNGDGFSGYISSTGNAADWKRVGTQTLKGFGRASDGKNVHAGLGLSKGLSLDTKTMVTFSRIK